MLMDTSARNIYRILAIITSFALLLLVAAKVERQLIWIGTAFFLAVALNPAVEFFAKYVTGRRRGLAIGITFLCLMIVLAGVVASLAPPLVRQSRGLVNNLPAYTDHLTKSPNLVGHMIRRYDLVERIKADQSQIVHQISSFGGSFFVVLRKIFSSLAATVTVLGLTFFMLLEGPNWIGQAWLRYRSPKKRHYQELVHQMYHSVTGYVNGNLLTSVLASILVALMLLILHVPYAAALAILVGVMDLIPLVGATLGAIVVIIVSLFHSEAAAVIMLIFFLIYQQTENHVLQPIVYGKTVRISPLLVLVSVIIGAGLGGLLGALVAIPIAASIQILIKDYFITHNHHTT